MGIGHKDSSWVALDLIGAKIAKGNLEEQTGEHNQAGCLHDRCVQINTLSDHCPSSGNIFSLSYLSSGV